jgi:hypothetical protein
LEGSKKLKSPLVQWEWQVGKLNFLGHTMFFITKQIQNCEKRQTFSETHYCFLFQEEKWNCKARWSFSGLSCSPHRKKNGTSRIGIRLHFLIPFLAI